MICTGEFVYYLTVTTLYHSKIPLQLIKLKGQNKRTQSELIRLIRVVFFNGTMSSVPDRSDSINEHTHTDQQQNKITYSVGVQEVPVNQLGNWLTAEV